MVTAGRHPLITGFVEAAALLVPEDAAASFLSTHDTKSPISFGTSITAIFSTPAAFPGSCHAAPPYGVCVLLSVEVSIRRKFIVAVAQPSFKECPRPTRSYALIA